MKAIWKWFWFWIRLKPHFIIGDPANPYMLRWYVWPRNPWLNLYLHKFLRDDDDRALHDHPWWFWSLMLKGSYIEHCGEDWHGYFVRTAGSLVFRPAEHRHRVTLLYDSQKQAYTGSIPCWTLVLTGRTVRNWGFWCPQGFVPWQEFVSHGADGNHIGKGCG